MKKKNLFTVILTAISFSAIFFKAYGYPYLAGLVTGASCTLLLMVTIGRWQAKRAAKIIDARLDQEKQQSKEWDDFVKKQLIDKL